MIKSKKKIMAILLASAMATTSLAGCSSTESAEVQAEQTQTVAVEESTEMVELQEATKIPKYVFYFIGDGFGATHRTLAEYYERARTGDESYELAVNDFPVTGLNTTYSADKMIPDSAAAGTALATGYKTNNDMVAVLPDGTNLKSLLSEAEAMGKATGIITTSVVIDATPAVFMAHAPERASWPAIADDAIQSGVDFLAGGGTVAFLPMPESGPMMRGREDDKNLFEELEAQGYTTFATAEATDAFKAYEPQGKEKVVAVFEPYMMPLEIDRKGMDINVPTLSEMTAKGISTLSQYDEEGFFMMVESGRIDQAGHANDAAAVAHEVLEFDNAIQEALEFYNEHPEETLIVVVGDHETGGLGLGFGYEYFVEFDQMLAQKVSMADGASISYYYPQAHKPYKKGGDREKYFAYIADNYGLTDLTDDERAKIDAVMDRVDAGEKPSKREFGGFNQVGVTISHIAAARSNVNWSSYNHTASILPLEAIGVGAENFGGHKDNTEVAKTMADLLGFELGPVDASK